MSNFGNSESTRYVLTLENSMPSEIGGPGVCHRRALGLNVSFVDPALKAPPDPFKFAG